MKSPSCCLPLLLLALATSSPAFDAAAFSPETWPGRAPATVERELRPLAEQLLTAMRARDRGAYADTKAQIVRLLGPHAGVPGLRPSYGQPVKPADPDALAVARLWRGTLGAQQGRFGWEAARRLEASPGAGGRVPRLRVSQRQITALLRSHEAGLAESDRHLATAVAGLDYLLTTQASTGVFGYPYQPGGGGLREEAAENVRRGERQGLTMVEREWVIEDLGAGGLNFDNGMCGAVLVHGYAVTGEPRYLAAAKRAGEWAIARPLALNFNYNGFSGVLLARLYRATREPRWLEAAHGIFEFGVMGGQLPNGRWFDQHNARVQYHALLCWQLTEYLVALRAARDPRAAEVERAVRAGLDNLAAELTRYGTNNPEEALSLEALSLGQAVIGPVELWRRAENVAVNYLTGPFLPIARERGGHLPEPVSLWLLRQRLPTGRTPLEAAPALAPP